MSAKFVDIPVEQFEQEYFAEEMQEARKLDKPARQKASGYAAALDALFEVSGCPAELHKGIHILLNKSLGKAPHEVVIFSEADAGALLPGDSEIVPSSKKKRWMRFWTEFEAWMQNTGKRLARRTPGYCKVIQKKEVKRGATYQSEVAQAVVDIERQASKMRRRRVEAYRTAALEVWSNLPAYVAEEVKPKLDTKPRPQIRLVGKRSRAMERFEKAASRVVEENKENGAAAMRSTSERMVEVVTTKIKEVAPDEAEQTTKSLFLAAARQILLEKTRDGETAIDEALADLHAELEALGAEARELASESETDVQLDSSSLDNTKWTETTEDATGETQARCTNFSPNLQKTQEKRENCPEELDRSVQLPAPHTCPSPDVPPEEIAERVAVIVDGTGLGSEEAARRARRELCEVCRSAEKPGELIE